MTRGRVAQVIDEHRYAEHVRTRFAGVVVVTLVVDLEPVVERGLRRLVEAGERREVPCHADGQGPCVASCCPIKGHRAPAACRPVHQHPTSTPEATPGARTGDRSAAGDCPIPRGGDRPSHGGVGNTLGQGLPPSGARVLSDREARDLSAAMRDPEYVRRMLADVTASRMVEVDNPFRREVRPRRA